MFKIEKLYGEEFDTDLFIDEIEKTPSIWDQTSSNYSKKIGKRKAREEIVVIFCDPSDTKINCFCNVRLRHRIQNSTD